MSELAVVMGAGGERADRKNPMHPDYSDLGVLNQTITVPGTTSATVFNRWYVQTQRHETAVLKNARQHCEESVSEVEQQTGGERGKGPGLPPVKQ